MRRVAVCLALAALSLGACRKRAPAGPPKENAQAILRDVVAALEEHDYEEALRVFRVPASLRRAEAVDALAGFLERREISDAGLEVLFALGRWGLLTDLIGRDKAQAFADRVQLPVGALWGYFGPNDEGQAIFVLGKTSLELVRVDDIGDLGPAPAGVAGP